MAGEQGLDSVSLLCLSMNCRFVCLFAWGVGGGADAQTQSREGNSEQDGACTVADFIENTPLWHFPAGLCRGVGLFMFPFEPNHHGAGSCILFLRGNAFISVALCHGLH